MKENSEGSKTNVCNEDVLKCIFKGVPNFVGDEEDLELGGSHHEEVVGRSIPPPSPLPTHPSLSSPSSDQLTNRKKKKKGVNLPAEESQLEFEIWSSPYSSKEKLETALKEDEKPLKKKKPRRWHMDELAMCRFADRLIRNTSSNDLLDRKLYEKYPDVDVLCDDCRWLVRATKSSELNKEEENGDIMDDEFFQALRKMKAEDSTQVNHSKNYKKSQVTKLLNEVQSSLVECSILLTTSRLRKKIKKEEEEKKENTSESVLNNVDSLLDSSNLSEFEVLIDEIKEEEDVKEGESKLCLALGRFISRYLKVS